MKFKSIAHWPADSQIPISEDIHDTEAQAIAVCLMLGEKGFGGDSKIFPIKTLVIPQPEKKADYSPWKPPFHYEPEGQRIEDSNNQMMLDMRGWGFLTGRGSGGLAMSGEVAAKIQDNIGRHVTDLINSNL